jgi:uncharacterized repeat protein (TIGR03847 family)
MVDSNNLGEPAWIVVGTIGEPGEREFYLQIGTPSKTISFALEKAQAASLSEKIFQIARELGVSRKNLIPESRSLELPVDSEFVIGIISLQWDGTNRRLIFELESATENPNSDESEKFRFQIQIESAIRFALATMLVVQAGRAPCIFCGGPINREGHLCPRSNGYRRQE